MGLGKTIQAISFLAYLYHGFKITRPFLICAPMSTLPNWQRELAKWFPAANVVLYSGCQKSRDLIAETEIYFQGTKIIKFNVMLTSYEYFKLGKELLEKIMWQVMVVDEGQRLKNADSMFFKLASSFPCNHRVVLTGTPLQNKLTELLSLLSFINEKKFDDKRVKSITEAFQSSIVGKETSILKKGKEGGNDFVNQD